MRLLITADLHFNHAVSQPLARDCIARMNAAGGDGVLLVGDTAIADGEALEQCLSLFTIRGPRILVAGNHELWTNGLDSYRLFREDLPRRVGATGWHWLEGAPQVFGDCAIVGSVGWYDYSFAQQSLGIPRRFYEAKLSPGAAARLPEYRELLARTDDIPRSAMEIVARWNDGRHIKLHRSDEAFLDELLAGLERSLQSVKTKRTVLVATHHLPFPELLPPPHTAQWDFAKAFLGSGRIGELIRRFDNVHALFCGHSHFAAEAQIGHIRSVNIGSGYRHKLFQAIDLPD